jgi:peptide/nickel transport system substrate-binding protein
MTPIARPVRRGRVRLLGALACVCLIATTCHGGGSPTQPATSGAVLRLGTDSGIDSLNPFVAQNTDSFAAFEYMYPELVQYDGNLRIAPDFATSWQSSPNGLTWTFHTHAGAKWSDRKPLTAADAAWTINTFLKFRNGSTAGLATLVAHASSAEAPDATTLVIHYRAPVANVLAQLQQMMILPEHVWSAFAEGNGHALITTPNSAPVVSGGPFVLKKFVKDQIALFKTNPDWYGPKPHIGGFGLQFFSSDDGMVQALKSGQLDAIEVVPPTDVRIVRDAGFALSTSPGLQFTYLSINSNPRKPKNRELLDPRVRLAFAHAVDRAAMDGTAYLGQAQPGSSVIAPITGSWHDARLQPETFDLALANRILDQAGYAKGPDGIRLANGHKMQYELIFPTYMGGPGDRMFQILQADFRKIGVAISERALDGDAAFAAVAAPNNKYLSFDLEISQWQPYMDPDFQLSVFLCEQFGNFNDSGYCNSAYENMYQRQGTLINQSERQQFVWKMQDLLYVQRPYIVFNYPNWIEAHSKKWTGFVMGPQGSFNEMSKYTMIQVHSTG